jgi:hypothetical protein
MFNTPICNFLNDKTSGSLKKEVPVNPTYSVEDYNKFVKDGECD